MKSPRNVAVSALALVALMLAGCAAQNSESATTIEQVLDQARAANDEAAVAALSDLTVTRAEVDAASDRMIACLEQNGLRVVDNGVNPLDGWRHELDIYWDGMSDSDGQRISDECQSKDYSFVSQGYYLMNEDQVDPAILPDILACVQGKGVEIPDDARSLRALLPLGSEDPNLTVVTTCAQTAAAAHGFTALSIVL